MITRTVRYEIDPDKLSASKTYAKARLHFVPKPGGVRYGYPMPHEGPNGIAYRHFSFASVADYGAYRGKMWQHAAWLRADDHAKRTRCIRRCDLSFTRPLFDGAGTDTRAL
ncbi:MAG: NIPSNAP family protein [Pseudomonadota bacterium]